MLYFDNAATTFPKPAEVRRAVCNAMIYEGANPGRSGYPMAIDTAKTVYLCRERASTLFGIPDPENVIFTKNCTEALNMVLMSGQITGHCIISDMEHNSVLRPLHKRKEEETLDYSVVCVSEKDPEETVRSYRDAFRKDTKLVVATGASNAFGIKLPVRELADLAHENGALFLLDAAQTAGTEHYDMNKDHIDFICAPGHKGLLGPMGTGLLLAKDPERIDPLLFGGTGNFSLEASQPPDWPERMESGTLNVPGIAGLSAGIDKVMREGEEKIGEREIELLQLLYSELVKMPEVTLYTDIPTKRSHAALLSFNLGDLTGEKTAEILAERGVATRGGFHCAALAHRKMGTEKRGTCRVSIGPMTTFDDMMKLIRIIYEETKKNCS